MLAILTLFSVLVLLISAAGFLLSSAGDSLPAQDLSFSESQGDSEAIARLGSLFNGLPCTVMIESKFSNIRHSQIAQHMLRGLSVRSGVKFSDIISTMERKFMKVDRKVFNLIRLAKQIHQREKDSRKVEDTLEPWLASLKASRERVSELVQDVPSVESLDISEPAELEDTESKLEEEEEEVEISPNNSEEYLEEAMDEGEVVIQELTRSHEQKYQLLLTKLDALIRETRAMRFLQRFTEINEFLNAYIGQVDAQISQLRKMNDLEIYCRTDGKLF